MRQCSVGAKAGHLMNCISIASVFDSIRARFSERTMGMNLKTSGVDEAAERDRAEEMDRGGRGGSGAGGDDGFTERAGCGPDYADGERGRGGEDCGIGFRGRAKSEDLGEADSGMRLESMALHIGLSAAQKTELDVSAGGAAESAVGAVPPMADPGGVWSALWADGGDLSKVTGWLEAQGFTVKSIAPSRQPDHVLRSGGAGRSRPSVRRFISTGDGRLDHIGNTTEIAIPKALAGSW